MSEQEKYLVEGSTYRLSLKKLMGGKKIKDMHGYISNEFGEPTFLICQIEFEDGSTMGVEGEHDHPYLTDYDDNLEAIIEKIAEEETEEDEEWTETTADKKALSVAIESPEEVANKINKLGEK